MTTKNNENLTAHRQTKAMTMRKNYTVNCTMNHCCAATDDDVKYKV